MKQNLVAPESVKTVVKPSSINLPAGGNLLTSLVLDNVEMFGKILQKIFWMIYFYSDKSTNTERYSKRIIYQIYSK